MFRRSTHPAPTSLRRYFGDIFFSSPFADDEIRSLVAENDGRVVGFIGALPRRMLLGNRPIRVAVATQLMVEPDPRNAFAAFGLVRTLFTGAQDLTFSDGANEWALGIWRRMGGDALRLASIEWRRVLRPAGFVRHALATKGRESLARAAMPLSRTLDEVAARLPIGALRPPKATLAPEELDPAQLVALLATRGETLRPNYDVGQMRWILERAGDTLGHGALRSRLLRDDRARPVGWYIYYAKPNGTARVLQFGATESGMDAVLEGLFADAWASGAVAITGQLAPYALRELSRAHCTFTCPGLDVLIHSRDEAVLRAAHRSDCFLTRLDAEWWLRFGADWRELEPATSNGRGRSHARPRRAAEPLGGSAPATRA